MRAAPFEVDQVYGYDEIRAKTKAGSTQSYLLSNGKKIVAGCFDPQLNPKAPLLVYPGPGPIIMSSAERVVLQRTPIPVFLKEGDKEYRYKGMYLATAFSREPHHIEDAKKVAPDRKPEIAGVIRFVPFTEEMEAAMG
jgi:hypothetical protein